MNTLLNTIITKTPCLLFILISLFLIIVPQSILSQTPSIAQSTLSPTTQPIQESALAITLHQNQPPTIQTLSNNIEPNLTHPNVPPTIQLKNSANLPTHPSTIKPFKAQAPNGFVDNWELLFEDDIEGVFPSGNCSAFDNDSSDNLEYYWNNHQHRSANGSWAAWLAAGGADALDPTTDSYPAHSRSWLYCGPYDFSQAQTAMLRFNRWIEINDSDDYLGVYFSKDGQSFEFLSGWNGISNWTKQSIYINGISGENSIYFAWIFHSDDDTDQAEGPWLDDLEIWRYNNPDPVCGDLNPGTKGVVIPPYQDAAHNIPIIRADDMEVVYDLVAADVKWVRLGFQHRAGFIRQEEYDRMVDTLCAYGISVLALVNHESLSRQDFNDSNVAVDYRAEFTEKVSYLVSRFENRISYWEVWNEPNYEPAPGLPPRIDPLLYAPLLNDTYEAIKTTNADALVVFGGLSSAWGDSNEYLEQVFEVFNNVLGSVRPYDYFALHPYANKDHGPNPFVYMYAVELADETTIIDKFLRTMATNNDGDKTIWVTEIGWNASKNSPNRPDCHDDVLVTKQEQATYLKPSFDILFHEVFLWGTTDPAIETIIWYQYQDTAIDYDAICNPSLTSNNSSMAWKGLVPAGDAYINPKPNVRLADWWFGLYDGNRNPNPVQCHFRLYPNECRLAYIPLIVK